MTIILIILLGLMSLLIGRLVFGKWFNHISLYSGIWATSLSLFELKLMHYYPLEIETWMMIGGAWFAFLIGSLTVVLIRFSQGKHILQDEIIESPTTFIPVEKEILIMNRTLWILNFITFCIMVQHWMVVLKIFGSITKVFIYGSILRSAFVQGDIPGILPYIDSLALVGALLAGAYTASTGRLKIVVVLSLVIVILLDIAGMSRARMLIGALLFFSGYTMNKLRRGKDFALKVSLLRRIVAITLLVAIFIGGAELVRSHRGVIESIKGSTKTLNKLRGGSFITPSIYMYMTVHPGVFNEYLKVNREKMFFSGYTFAPFWRILAKIGFDTNIKQYQTFYRTPISANTGTYLHELHADYGIAGVFIVPYLLGFIASYFWYKIKVQRCFRDIIILGHIYVILGMSIIVFSASLGYWFASLIFGLMISIVLDRKIHIGHYKAV